MPKLCIDPGHGGRDSGGVGINIVGPDNYEKHEVLAIGLALADMARAAGIEVMMTRTTDTFVGITDRWQRANAWGADLFLSIHTNASGGRGIEVLYGKAQYASLAKQLAQEIHAATGWPLRRDAGGYYKPSGVGVIKNTSMPALLSESGFIDVAEENAAMDTDQWTVDIARAHLRFVLNYFGLEAGGEKEEPMIYTAVEKPEQGELFVQVLPECFFTLGAEKYRCYVILKNESEDPVNVELFGTPGFAVVAKYPLKRWERKAIDARTFYPGGMDGGFSVTVKADTDNVVAAVSILKG